MRVEDKLLKLRELMQKKGIDAVIVPSSDNHSSEYVHPRWKFRGWLSGFNGSAGIVVVTKERAGLWTDFRYYIEADQSLSGTEIELFKQGLDGVPTVTDFIKECVSSGGVVGFDGNLFSTSLYERYNNELSNFTLDISFDPTIIWDNRPDSPTSKAYDFDIKYCGESREDKLKRVRDIMRDKGVNYYIISSLADIAWIFNIRGADIDYTPLVISYALVSEKRAILFIDSGKVDNDLASKLKSGGVDTLPYSSLSEYIVSFPEGSTVYYMPEVLNSYLSGLIPVECNVKRGQDITSTLKAVKNKSEIKNIRVAMEKDGVALVKFFKNLEESVEKGNLTEFSLTQQLRKCRLQMEDCVDESFGAIIGYESNGALCHYSVEEKSAKRINKKGLLLIDSGGQYLQGTTDITRTISMGEPTEEEILHYTLVLKGHIKLGMAKFPSGTTGGQLDVLAREHLWKYGLDYGHGTGHGVGFFLGVHEGPQRISTKSCEIPMEEGMVTSNEPGLYIEGKHGIRIENLVLTTFAEDGLENKFLGFETLTLYPYDVNLIDRTLLSEEEIYWINNYHSEVVKRLSPYLGREELDWLKGKACEI